MSMSIKGKNWFYYLNNVGKTNLLMSEEYTRTQTNDTFIVCWQIENKSSITEQQWTRVYTSFPNAMVFYDFLQNVKQEERCFFEIILGSKCQKPHFDIDINACSLKQDEPLDIFSDDLIETVIQTIRATLTSEINHKNDDKLKINVYTSHSTIKRSYHLIIEKYYHKSNKEAIAFYRQIVDKLPEQMKPYVDQSVYAQSQQFRLLGCSKFGTSRVKRSVDNSFDKDTFINSLVSVVDFNRCIFLPLYEQTYDKNPNFSIDSNTFSQNVNDAKKVLKSYYESFPLNYDCFSITSVKNDMVILKRERITLCPLCNRKHDHENAYLTTFNDKGYYHCRRMEREKFSFKLIKEPIQEYTEEYTEECI